MSIVSCAHQRHPRFLAPPDRHRHSCHSLHFRLRHIAFMAVVLAPTASAISQFDLTIRRDIASVHRGGFRATPFLGLVPAFTRPVFPLRAVYLCGLCIPLIHGHILCSSSTRSAHMFTFCFDILGSPFSYLDRCLSANTGTFPPHVRVFPSILQASSFKSYQFDIISDKSES